MIKGHRSVSKQGHLSLAAIQRPQSLWSGFLDFLFFSIKVSMALKDHFMFHVTTEVNLTVFSIADRRRGNATFFLGYHL